MGSSIPRACESKRRFNSRKREKINEKALQNSKDYKISEMKSNVAYMRTRNKQLWNLKETIILPPSLIR